MRPLDPRLLRHAAAARGYVYLTAVLGAVTAALLVAQALLLARVIAGVTIGGDGWGEVRTSIAWLAAALLGRAVTAWAQERFAHRAATRVIAQLRAGLVDHACRSVSGARVTTGADHDGAELATLSTRGLDALDGYFVRFLPQLLLAATVTPALLAVIWWQDTVAALTVAVTLPLVPIFMILVGLSTQRLAQRRLRTMQRLGAQVLDLVAGLPTLWALGRERGQAVRVREVGDSYRRATMSTLRTAFLSALVLEALTTLSVAMVAVGIGLRLVYGDLDLQTGLAVLILAPEVYLPLRQVGLHYHASVDGLAAASGAFDVLQTPEPPAGTVDAPDLRRATIQLSGVGVHHRGRDRWAPLAVDLLLEPGRIVAMAGPTGSGKSSAVDVLLGLRRPDAGHVTVVSADGAVDLADVRHETWVAQISWVPQRPALVPGSVADNVRLLDPDADDADVARAAADAAFDEVVAELPEGWATMIGSGGHGLSAGQRQRLALTRLLLRPGALVVLDEPTAHLDSRTELVIHQALRTLARQGRMVLVVAHRPALLALADDVVDIGSAGLVPA